MSYSILRNGVFGSKYTYSFLAKGFHIVFGFISTIVINRYLGVEIIGDYAYITNIIAMMVTVGNLGIYQSYPYSKRQGIKDVTNLYLNLVVKQFLVYLLIATLLLSIVYMLGDINTGNLPIISIAILLLITSILSQQISMIASVEFFKFKSITFILAEFTKIILLLCMYFVSVKNLFVLLCVNTLYQVVIVVLCFIKFKVRISFKDHSLAFVWSTVKKGLIPMLFTLLLSMNYRIDIILLKESDYVSATEVGLFSVGMQLAAYVWIFPDIFKEVLFSKTAKDDSIKDIIYSIKLSLLAEVIFLAFILVFGETLFTILYGDEFAEAVNVTRIIFIGVLSMTLFKLLTPLYNAKGKFMENFIILFSSVLLNILLNLMLIPTLGSEGAAIASVFGYSVCGVVYLMRFKKEYKLTWKQLLIITKADVEYLRFRILKSRTSIR